MTNLKSLEEKGINIFYAASAAILLESILMYLMQWIGPSFYRYFHPEQQFFFFFKPDKENVEIVSAVFLAPLWEELTFRVLPMQIAKKMSAKFDDFKYYLATLLGIFFGFCHGGVANIFVQGISGVFLGFLYIKNNYSYISVVIAHSLINFTISTTLPIFINAG